MFSFTSDEEHVFSRIGAVISNEDNFQLLIRRNKAVLFLKSQKYENEYERHKNPIGLIKYAYYYFRVSTIRSLWNMANYKKYSVKFVPQIGDELMMIAEMTRKTD